MRWYIQSNMQRFKILQSHEPDSDDTPIEFKDRFFLLHFLRSFAGDPFSMTNMRNALAEVVPTTNICGLTDDEILQQFASRIICNHFILVPEIRELPSLTGSVLLSDDDTDADSTESAESAEQLPPTDEEPSAPPVIPEEETNWIEFRIIDDETGLVVSGIRLSVRLPNGEIRDYTTDANGIVHIDDISSGTCDIVELIDPDASEVIAIE